MPNQLRDLRVDTVSLVSRTAVRDPRDPSEPRRFLLTKADGGTDTPADGGLTPADYESSNLRKDTMSRPLTDARAWQQEADRIAKEDAQGHLRSTDDHRPVEDGDALADDLITSMDMVRRIDRGEMHAPPDKREKLAKAAHSGLDEYGMLVSDGVRKTVAKREEFRRLGLPLG